SSVMPEVCPARYTFSPISMNSGSMAAPADMRMWSTASMISAPMPSPRATVIGILPAMPRPLSETGSKIVSCFHIILNTPLRRLSRQGRPRVGRGGRSEASRTGGGRRLDVEEKRLPRDGAHDDLDAPFPVFHRHVAVVHQLLHEQVVDFVHGRADDVIKYQV